MPILTMEESNYAGPIPEDTVLPAKVTAITQKKKPFKDDDGNDIWRMEFSFTVEDPNSDFDGTRLWGDTSTTFNNHPDCKLRAWAQEILATQLDAGFVLDTDILVGQRCRIVVGVKEYQKDGQTKTRNFVRDVMRPSGGGIAATDEEPF